MTRFLDAQTCGSLAVLAAFASSEAAASYLNAAPSSPWAWYLNLEVFYAFEVARRPESPLHLLFGPNAVSIYAVMLILILAARVARIQFAVALFCNLAFLATLMMAYAGMHDSPNSKQASLDIIGFSTGFDGLVAALLMMSFPAFVLSHVGFAVTIVRQARHSSAPAAVQ